MKGKTLLYWFGVLLLCLNILSCNDHETKNNEETVKPEQLIVGTWQLIEHNGSGDMLPVENGIHMEYTSDGEVHFSDWSGIYWFDVDKLCLSTSLSEEPLIIYSYEFDEDRLTLETFSTTLPVPENTPTLVVYKRVQLQE